MEIVQTIFIIFLGLIGVYIAVRICSRAFFKSLKEELILGITEIIDDFKNKMEVINEERKREEKNKKKIDKSPDTK